MDPRKDVNVSGNRVVNVADPIEPNHVATKSYADYLHLLAPDSDEFEYVRYIRSRRDTQCSLTRLCTIEWDVIYTAEKDQKPGLQGTSGPFHLLESAICPSILRISPQQLARKYIMVKYRYDVRVINWKISLTYQDPKDQPALDFRFVWQVSPDYRRWGNVTEPTPIEVKNFPQRRDGNDGEMIFRMNNPDNIRAKYWRVNFTAGQLQQNFYVNQLYMKLSA